MDAPIYVVVASDDVTPKHREPGRTPNPIVFETDVAVASLERAYARAARAEADGYGACRIARLVFLDEEAAEASEVLHVGGSAGTPPTSNSEDKQQ